VLNEHPLFVQPVVKTGCTTGLTRRLRGDKIVHNYYDSDAAVKLNFNAFNTTRGNMYKLQKFMCHYNVRKY